MSTSIQRRRGTTAQHSSFTGANGEITIDTDKEVVVVHDGATAGGYPGMRENGSNSALAIGSAASPSLKFTGDTNTGLYSPGADQVAISTNGAGRVFVNNTGLGVGIAASRSIDVYRSDAAGSAILRLSDVDSRNVELRSPDGLGNTAGVGSVTNHDFTFFINNTERARLDTNGRLGLGTSTPQSAIGFPIGTTTWISQVAGTNHSASNTGSLGIGIYDGSTFSGVAVNNTHNGTYSSQDIRFSTAEGGISQTTERMRITPAGRVGIGTTSPAGKCVVRVSNNTGAPTAWNSNFLVVSNGDAGTSSGLGFSIDTDSSSTSISSLTPGTGWLKQNYRANSHVFWYGDAGVTQAATIDSSGRLLVGTSSSASAGDSQYALIQVQGNSFNSGTTGILSIRRGQAATSIASGSGIGNIVFADSAGNPFATVACDADAAAGTNDYPGRLVFSTTADGASSPTERMRIKNNGTINFSNVATYADNAAATTGGLAVGDVYRTSTGQLMIRY